MLMKKKKQCFLFRRHEFLRMHFAAVVSKRLFTERITATSKASVLEHKRSAMWCEREYELLVLLLRDQGGSTIVNQACTQFWQSLGDEDEHALFCDYAGLIMKPTDVNPMTLPFALSAKKPRL